MSWYQRIFSRKQAKRPRSDKKLLLNEIKSQIKAAKTLSERAAIWNSVVQTESNNTDSDLVFSIPNLSESDAGSDFDSSHVAVRSYDPKTTTNGDSHSGTTNTNDLIEHGSSDSLRDTLLNQASIPLPANELARSLSPSPELLQLDNQAENLITAKCAGMCTIPNDSFAQIDANTESEADPIMSDSSISDSLMSDSESSIYSDDISDDSELSSDDFNDDSRLSGDNSDKVLNPNGNSASSDLKPNDGIVSNDSNPNDDDDDEAIYQEMHRDEERTAARLNAIMEENGMRFHEYSSDDSSEEECGITVQSAITDALEEENYGTNREPDEAFSKRDENDDNDEIDAKHVYDIVSSAIKTATEPQPHRLSSETHSRPVSASAGRIALHKDSRSSSRTNSAGLAASILHLESRPESRPRPHSGSLPGSRTESRPGSKEVDSLPETPTQGKHYYFSYVNGKLMKKLAAEGRNKRTLSGNDGPAKRNCPPSRHEY